MTKTNSATFTNSDIEFANFVGDRAKWTKPMLDLGVGTHASPILLIRAARSELDETGARISYISPSSDLSAKLMRLLTGR